MVGMFVLIKNRTPLRDKYLVRCMAMHGAAFWDDFLSVCRLWHGSLRFGMNGLFFVGVRVFSFCAEFCFQDDEKFHATVRAK